MEMNREIKFRGKRIDNGEWVYGYYVKDPKGMHRIYFQPFLEATSNTYYFVQESTVGQYTGLKDKNGVEIYDGDVYSHNHRNFIMKITPFYGVFSVEINKSLGSFHLDGQLTFKHNRRGYDDIKNIIKYIEIIGNIYENHELIQ